MFGWGGGSGGDGERGRGIGGGGGRLVSLGLPPRQAVRGYGERVYGEGGER